jgi:heat-inducible transcriptional repressor
MCAYKEPLDERKQRILKAVVHEHVETAEPVGSESLVQHYDFGVRSATVRNEMADLADMGYLRQPHTSAGRVPSDMGYRFYVDRLMGPAQLQKREEQKARERLSAAAMELEQILSQTCRILTSITRYTSIATQPVTNETTIRHINISKLDDRKLLLIIVLSDGRVEHGLIDSGGSIAESDVTQTSSIIASEFVGIGINSVRLADTDSMSAIPHRMLAVYTASVALLKQVAESLAAPESGVYVEGTNYVIRQPEFKDLMKLEAILTVLEERARLYQLLSQVMLDPDVTVMIGSENPYRDMQDTSFVAARYTIGDYTAGTIGVIGPTRMDYRRAVAAVESMARNLSELLTDLSFS